MMVRTTVGYSLEDYLPSIRHARVPPCYMGLRGKEKRTFKLLDTRVDVLYTVRNHRHWTWGNRFAKDV